MTYIFQAGEFGQSLFIINAPSKEAAFDVLREREIMHKSYKLVEVLYSGHSVVASGLSDIGVSPVTKK